MTSEMSVGSGGRKGVSISDTHGQKQSTLFGLFRSPLKVVNSSSVTNNNNKAEVRSSSMNSVVLYLRA